MGMRDGWLRMAGKWGWLGRDGFSPRKLPWAQMSSRLVRSCFKSTWEAPSPVFNFSGIDLSGSEPEASQAMLEVVRTGESFAAPTVPGGSGSLKEAIAKEVERDRKVSLDYQSEVLVTDGATGAIRLIAEAFVNRGDKAVVVDPGSPMHRSILSYRGAKVHSVGARVNHLGFHEFQLAEFTAALHDARILILSQPNNPDGGMWHPDRLGELQWWAKKKDLLIVVDETYVAYLPEEQQKALAQDKGWDERVLTVGSLSKSHAAAGARIGWVHGPAKLVNALQKVAEIQGLGISWPAEKAALRLLGNPGVVPLIRQRVQDHRVWAERKLTGFGMSPVSARAGYFLWLPTWNLNPSSRQMVESIWSDCQVRVAPGEAFGDGSQGHIRINLAGDPGRFQEGMNRLENWSGGNLGKGWGDFSGNFRPQALKKAA